LALVLVVLFSPASSQAVKGKIPFKLVGYYSLQSAMTDALANVPFDKLTHINLWF
jgi:GH18 family chitinase